MKLGLVLEGGASRTLFSCGVMDALLENKIYADYVIGVSAGIAYGVSYASGQIGRNLQVSAFMSDKRYMGFKHMLNPKNRSYYNMNFVFEEIPNSLVHFDFDAFAAYPGRVVAVVTNIKTGKPEYIDVPRNNSFFKLIEASCALPIMFQPIEIDGKTYMDGGISDSIPYRHALTDGCDKLITILTREKSYVKTEEHGASLARLVYKNNPEFLKAIENRPKQYNDSRSSLFEYSEKSGAIVIMPENTTGFKRTESDYDKLKKLYDDGYNTAQIMMPQIIEYLNS